MMTLFFYPVIPKFGIWPIEAQLRCLVGQPIPQVPLNLFWSGLASEAAELVLADEPPYDRHLLFLVVPFLIPASCVAGWTPSQHPVNQQILSSNAGNPDELSKVEFPMYPLARFPLLRNVCCS